MKKKTVEKEITPEVTVNQTDVEVNAYAFVLGLIISAGAAIASFIFIRKAMLIPTGNVTVEGSELHYSGIDWTAAHIVTILTMIGLLLVFGITLALTLGGKGIMVLIAAFIFIAGMVFVCMPINVFTGAGNTEANRVENAKANSWFHDETGYDYDISGKLQHSDDRYFVNGHVIDIGNHSYVLEGKRGKGETIYKIRNIDDN